LLRIFVFTLAIALLPLKAQAQESLQILYTGAIKGELEPCGCSPETQSGGLARLSGFLMEEGGSLKPFILIDAGNSLAEDTAQGRLKSEALLRSFAVMGYDALAFFKSAAVPPASLNVRPGKNAITDIPGQRRSIETRRGEIRVNISADPKGLKKGPLNVLLTEKPVTGLKNVSGWDVVITSSGELLDEPVRIEGSIIISGYPKGEKLGVLKLSLDSHGKVSGFSHRWQPLGKEVKEDARVRAILKEYDTKVAALLVEKEKEAASLGPYLGEAACVECHEPFSESWKATRHARAFETLERVGKSKDPECVVCHTTGFGEAGGFYSKKATPGLADVQCEVCHGPGKDHVREGKATMAVDRSLCLRCHTAATSPFFDYESYRERIKH